MPPKFDIPAFVRSYLAKGSKFIPDTFRSTVPKVLHEVAFFERKLHLAAFLSERHGVARGSVSPEDTDVAIYCRMLRNEPHGYVPSTKSKNFDFVDLAA